MWGTVKYRQLGQLEKGDQRSPLKNKQNITFVSTEPASYHFECCHLSPKRSLKNSGKS